MYFYIKYISNFQKRKMSNLINSSVLTFQEVITSRPSLILDNENHFDMNKVGILQTQIMLMKQQGMNDNEIKNKVY